MASRGSADVRRLFGVLVLEWRHLHLNPIKDQVDPEVFPAQGLPDFPDEPGGLDWDQLGEALTAAARNRGCIGMSMTIYDPEQDPDRAAARRIVHLIRRVTDALGHPV